MLCRPTKVAAANCHALLPESSHWGDGASIILPYHFCSKKVRNPRCPIAGGMRALGRTTEARAMPALWPGEEALGTPGFSGKSNPNPVGSKPICTKVRQLGLADSYACLCRKSGFGYGSAHGDVGATMF